jgi:cell division septation protein DedD
MTSNAGTSNAGTSNAGTATRSTTTQVAAKPAKPVPVPAAAATAEHPSAKGVSHGKATAVQLAALSSEDAAKSEWQRMSRHMPDLLGGRTPTYMKVEHDGHTVWRLRVAGFSDSAQAKAFCEQVHAKRANCAVADF